MPPASLPHLVAMGAGVLTLAAGAFVLAARPHSGLHRLFFLLAVADGGSTVLFRMSYLALDPTTASYFRATYWYFFLSFLVLLVVFGIAFPVARASVRTIRVASVATVALGLAAILVYAMDHALFWSMTRTAAGVAFPNGPLGNVATAVFVGTLALVALLLTRDLKSSPSASHRRQSAFVMGGLTLAYAPYGTTSLVQGALTDPQRALLTGPAHVVLAYWTFVAYVAVIVCSAIVLWRVRDPERAQDRRFVLLCYAGVVALTIPAIAWPTTEALAAVRAVAFVFYPILLGYAIVRYEVFDIDRQVRRASTVTLVIGALTLVFVLAQNVAEAFLQETFLSGFSSTWASGAVAALAVAAVTVPVARVSRNAARRIVPEISGDELHKRKLEVYRHSLAGALADGLIEERESRTLIALRESLGITPTEHERVLAEVRAGAAAV